MYKLTGNLLFLFCGFFITQISPVSPFHISLILSFILLGMIILKNKKILINNVIVLTSLLIIYLVVTQIYNGGNLNVLISVIYSLIYLPLIIQVFMNLDEEHILKICYKFIQISTIVLIVESIFRVTPYINQLPEALKTMFTGTEFYVFKYNSIMYNDSNFVAMFISILYAFTFYLEKKYRLKKYKFILIIQFLLCVLTFSRAAIITLVCFYILNYVLNNKRIFIFFIVLIIPTIIIGGAYTIKEISVDGSFQMKINTILDGLSQFKGLDIKNILFGIGFNNAPNLLGRSAHNFILTYLIETGVLGLLFILGLYIFVTIKTNYRALYLLIPFIIIGMSFAPYAIPYMYAMIGVIYCLNRKEYEI